MSNFVNIIDYMGNDLTIVNAARVSFNQVSSLEEGTNLLKNKDKSLIKYLVKHGHWSPFSHAFVTFHIKAPIFVARQLSKHQVGFSWNEVSRRYVTLEPEIYSPLFFRKAADNIKQGSLDEPIKSEKTIEYIYLDVTRHCKDAYDALLKAGVCAEQARTVLPLATYTEWYWSGSLQGWSRVCKQRLADDTQKETRLIVKFIANHMQQLFPVSWKELLR